MARRGVGAIAVLLLAAGCAATSLGSMGLAPGEVLAEHASVLVLAVEDALDAEGDPASHSGTLATMALRQVLSESGRTVVVSDRLPGREAFAHAEELGCDYLIEASFTIWHDAASDWRIAPDRAVLRVRILRVADEALVAFAHDESVGDSLKDVHGSPHRFLDALVKRMLEPILAGEELESVPEDALSS